MNRVLTAPAPTAPTVPAVPAVPAMPTAPTGQIAAQPQSADSNPAATPVRLTIPVIGVNTTLIRLGLTASGAMQVPSDWSVAGWYTGSPRPGAIGPAVIVGHIDSRTGPAVFYRLAGLRRGDKVYVRTGRSSSSVSQRWLRSRRAPSRPRPSMTRRRMRNCA